MKANGTQAPKVFKLKTFTLKARETILIQKSHHLKPVTTRVFHSGAHALEVQVNGKSLKKVSFQLEV